MKNFMKQLNKDSKKAFALLFAVVVISAIITTSLAVAALVGRGLDLASIGERSMRAFFAARSGLECALYWDIRHRTADGASPFRTGTGGGYSTDTITCLGLSVTVIGSGTVRQFIVNNGVICASVEVQLFGLETEVRSSGFSVCSPMGDVERGLSARY